MFVYYLLIRSVNQLRFVGLHKTSSEVIVGLIRKLKTECLKEYFDIEGFIQSETNTFS
jgi:hypothetical protein